MKKFDEKELNRRVDEVLFYVWDPIGVSDEPYARGEYKSNVGRIVIRRLRGSLTRRVTTRPTSSFREHTMPNDWRNWVFYICIPAGCAIASALYLWKSSARGHPMQIPRPSLQYSVGAVIALVVLLELLIGNYVIIKRFSPFPYWAYSLSFSLVPIVSGCAAWSLFASTWRYTPTVLTTLIPIASYCILFFAGELAHIALFNFSGGR